MIQQFYIKLANFNQQYQASRKNYTTGILFNEIEAFLLTEADNYPQNNELWFRLISLQYYPPLEIPESIILYASKILENDPLCSDALVIKAYTEFIFYSSIHPNTVLELFRAYSPANEKMAMIEIMLSVYHAEKKEWVCKKASLKKAVTLAPHFAYPYFELAYHYIEHHKNKKHESLSLLKMGLANTRLRNYDENFDITDINYFFDDFITQTHTHQNVIQRAIKALDKLGSI